MFTDALPNLLIGLREGLEAGLIVSILVATVVRSGRRQQLGPLWLGVVAAVALSLSFGAILTFAAADLSSKGQEAIGGFLSIVAVGFVTWMVFWMRRSARGLSAELTSKTEAAIHLGSRVLVATAFVAVAREGLESALFLWSTTRTASESTGPLVGALLGFVIAGALCFALYRRVLKINLSRFFTWTGAGLIVVAAGVLGYGVAELQEAAILPGAGVNAFDLSAHLDPTAWYARLVEGVFNLTPTMTVLRVIAYLGYLVVVLGLFLFAARRSAAPKPASSADRAGDPVPASDTAPDVQPAGDPEPAGAAADADAASPALEPEPAGRRRNRTLVLIGVAVVLVPLLAVIGVLALDGTKDESAHTAIRVTDKACGPGWRPPASGSRTFDISNDSTRTVEVYLQSANAQTTYGEIEGLSPGTTRPLKATLPPGSYQWRCVRLDGSETRSAPGSVQGKGVAAGRTYTPVRSSDLEGAVSRYRSAVQDQLAVLATGTDRLAAAVDGGDLAGARPLWITAHQDYERLGAAYGTFGEFDTEINGRPDGLAKGVDDPAFTGFLRLEHELWNPQGGDDLAGIANRLADDVHRLVEAFPSLETDPNDLALRAHEIIENTLQFELTGQTDQGSHSNLATARANVDGTRTVLDALAPLLRTRDADALRTSTDQLDELATMLDGYRRPDGSWTPLERLTRSQRQQLDAMTGELVEALAPIPTVLELAPSAGN